MAQASTGRLAAFWCKTMHPSPMWPSHGQYRCRTCFREYPVQWEPVSVIKRASPPKKEPATLERIPRAA
jgi:hypothetical protein